MTLDSTASGAGCHEAPKDMGEDPDSTTVGAQRITVAVDVRAADWRRRWPDAEAAVRQAALAAVRAGASAIAAPDGIEISLVLADDAAVQALNRDYLGCDAPTNVLAFPQGTESAAATPGPVLLGDVVLALETVSREAAAQGKSAIDHARHLVVHGVLHLLGFDHDTAAAATDMERREAAILAGLGIADPYADDKVMAAPAEAERR